MEKSESSYDYYKAITDVRSFLDRASASPKTTQRPPITLRFGTREETVHPTELAHMLRNFIYAAIIFSGGDPSNLRGHSSTAEIPDLAFRLGSLLAGSHAYSPPEDR